MTPRRSLALLSSLLVACGEPVAPDAGGPPDAAVTRPPDAAPPDTGEAADAAAGRPPDGALPDAAPPPPPLLRINEVDCRDPAHVEIANAGSAAADLAGFTVVAAQHPGRVLRLDGRLEAGALLDVAAPPFAVHCGATTVTLLRPDGTEADRVDVPLGPAAATWGRLTDGWGTTEPTPGTPNVPLLPPAPELFDPAVVHEIALTIAPDAWQVLRDAGHIMVDAALAAEGDTTPVGVRLGGRDGRYRRIDQKPSLRLAFDHRAPERRFRGLQGLVLDPAGLDPAVLTRWLAGEVLRAAGVVAPRVGFARLAVNGEDYGLYLVVEAWDAGLADRHFPSTWHVYEGAGLDLVSEHVEAFDVEVGEPAGRRGLVPVVAALEAAGADLFGATADYVDWDAVLRAMAAEVWMGSVDGYAVGRRAVALHIDALPRLTLLPAGTDLAFRARSPVHAGAGRLLTACLADAACAAAWDATLADVSAALADLELLPAAQALAARLRPHVARDPRTLFSVEMFDADVAVILGFLAERPAEMAALGACLRDAADADGDGAVCDADCAPDDPAVHAGAAEVCGDGVDQDCSGVADDGACPVCTPLDRGGHGYLVCPGSWTWADARRVCTDRGLDLVAMDDAGENRWLRARAAAVRRQDWWLGLSDTAREGTFAWVDGRERGFANWGGGEPNDYGAGEDCAQLRSDGAWNDLPCDAGLGALCEAPCDPATDADGDGHSACGADCDDADPQVHPGAVDVCGDGVDQDCSGVPDDGAGEGDCDCAAFEREGRRYLVCPRPQPYAAARELCRAHGGDLVVVGDAAENAWLFATATGLVPQRYWIGLDDLAVEGAYRWVDGTRPRFVAWSRGEPNDSGRAEDCGHFWEDAPRWNDIGCDAALGAICVLRTAD